MDLRNKVITLKAMKQQLVAWQLKGNKVVFTNGCFDLIHQGHLHLLRECKKLGDKLIVAVNADSSVKKLKGENRPVKDENTRAEVLSSLMYVDAVVIFDEETPKNLIENLNTIDVLVKGGDYKKAEIVGADIVEENGGEVVIIPFLDGFSSTNLIEKM